MYVKEIELVNFRNYKKLKVSFNERVNIFLGSNAQGKTNLLEGIYLNAIGKSFKTLRDKELIKFDEDICRIKTTYVSDDEEHVNEIVISGDGKKAIKTDGIKISRSSELLDRIYIIVFSPEDLKIVKDEPEKRRRFIDRELCLISPGYFNDLNNYRKSLKQRNAYLKENEIENQILDIWDYEIASHGSRIIKKRKEFIEKINEISQDIHHKITGGLEDLHVKYEPNVYEEDELKEKFIEILKNSREDDIRNRTTGKGPHKDDIKISADGIDLRKYGSQGQQRTAALSLKLSEIRLIENEIGQKPVLLLDDVLSELDNDRQKYLINSLGNNQMFITTTDIIGTVAKSLPEGRIFKISGGKIELEI